MPAAFIIRFTPPSSGRASTQADGRILHAAFLKMLAGLNLSLADSLHGQERHKPFTLAPELITMTDDSVSGEDALFGLRITSLSDSLTDQLIRLTEGDHALEIGQFRLPVRDIVCSGDAHSGRESYQDIIGRSCQKVQSVRKIKIFFDTPTTFRSGRQNLLFPQPSLIFNGLRDKWDAFSGLPLPVFPSSRFDELLYPSRYKLRTNILSFRTYRQIGFAGYCEYLLDQEMTTEEQRIILILTNYIVYAGIGYKTTMGMGLARGKLSW